MGLHKETRSIGNWLHDGVVCVMCVVHVEVDKVPTGARRIGDCFTLYVTTSISHFAGVYLAEDDGKSEIS